MIKKYQVTLYSTTGKYKPVSAIVEMEEINPIDPKQVKSLSLRGTRKICLKRYWNSADLKKYGYTQFKYRELK